jgi:hypothetical protein
MTDFCISAVRLDKDEQHIEWVRVHECQNAQIGPARTVSRRFVADLIRLGLVTFQTTVKDSSGKWKHGASVHVFDGEYLATDRNNTKKDNLGNLPKF